MADLSIRRDRLFALLPRIYATQPNDSALGVLISMMAAQLTALDDDLTRVLRDRWVGLASGLSGNAAALSALELLGGLLDRPRLGKPGPADTADLGCELVEGYRQRLIITARALTGGLGTPRGILSLAMADLGAEACPLMETVPPKHSDPPSPKPSDSGWRVDGTVAWGVLPSIRRACEVCAKGVGPFVSKQCPNKNERVLDGWITENPLRADEHIETGAAFWRPFVIPSQNLAADRPVVELTALADTSYPALRNCVTGEITLFADILRDGETLTIWPEPLAGETQGYDAFDGFPHHVWLIAHPHGQAVVTASGRPQRDVSGSIFFLSGVRFDEPPEDPPAYAGPPPVGGAEQASLETGTRFSVLESVVRTPLLRPGNESWSLLQFANPGRRFDDSDSRYGDGSTDQEGARFADWDASVAESDAKRAQVLFKALVVAEQAAAIRAAEEAQSGQLPKKVADLTLHWFSRAPATFRLTIPRTGWVEKAEASGALDLLRADLDLARPAGVRALLDFPQPAWQESLPPDEDWRAELLPQLVLSWPEDAGVADRPAPLVVSLPLQEEHESAESPLLMGGYYDVTRFDVTILR